MSNIRQEIWPQRFGITLNPFPQCCSESWAERGLRYGRSQPRIESAMDLGEIATSFASGEVIFHGEVAFGG
jgi:hypothetical protein